MEILDSLKTSINDRFININIERIIINDTQSRSSLKTFYSQRDNTCSSEQTRLKQFRAKCLNLRMLRKNQRFWKTF